MTIGWSTTNIRSNDLIHKVKHNFTSTTKCKSETNSRYWQGIDDGTLFCTDVGKGDREMCTVRKINSFNFNFISFFNCLL